MEAYAAKNRPGQAISPGTINGVMTEKGEKQNTNQTPHLTERKGEKKESGIERQQDRNRDQESEKKLARGTRVFEAFIRHRGVGPQEAADIGDEPKPIDA